MQQESMNTILMFRTRERTLAVPIEMCWKCFLRSNSICAPGMASAMAGMISLRGDVMPVIDSAVLIGAGPLELHPQQKFLMVESPRGYSPCWSKPSRI
jgi:chemotaxis signal transduction protein